MRVKLKMKPVPTIVRRLGMDEAGDVQRYFIRNVNRRIGKYMPHLTGTLETKSKRITSNTEITVFGPYAQYQYYGKVMLGLPPKIVTDRDLQYTRDFNPLAGPFWDERLMAAEGDAIVQDVQAYVRRRKQ